MGVLDEVSIQREFCTYIGAFGKPLETLHIEGLCEAGRILADMHISVFSPTDMEGSWGGGSSTKEIFH